jgi:cyclopropane-fatty-acyl-phospholipid synthase
MTSASIALDDAELRRAPAAFRTAVSIAHHNWVSGSLTFVMPSGRELRIEGHAPGPHGRLVVRDFTFVSRVLASADIGFGEGYMAGEWDSPDLSALLEVFTLNFDRLEQLVEGNVFMRVMNFLAHALNRNSRRGSKRNIHAHYDLGNAFYARWLDPSMTYSSARYEHPGQALSDAQKNKYATLAQEIGLASNHHVLEIGCGWGGFAEFAAKDVGARVTGVTISQAQHDFARKRLFEQGLAERADIQLMDYRDIQGRFDRVASIEMFEAVGEAYWPGYFSKVRDVLAPGGRAPTSCANTSSRAACCQARRACAKRSRRPGWNGSRWCGLASTTPTPWPIGPSASTTPGRRSGGSGSTSGSDGSGVSTSAIARQASEPSAPTSSSSASRGPDPRITLRASLCAPI